MTPASETAVLTIAKYRHPEWRWEMWDAHDIRGVWRLWCRKGEPRTRSYRAGYVDIDPADCPRPGLDDRAVFDWISQQLRVAIERAEPTVIKLKFWRVPRCSRKGRAYGATYA